MVGLAPASVMGINNGDIDTLECALLERMYFCKVGDGYEAAPDVKEDVVAARLGSFMRELQGRCGQATPVSLEEVVESYRGRKRTIYQQALESLIVEPLHRRDAESNSFVKVEKANPSKAPRCIQPRSSRYNLCLGRYVKHVEHRVYKQIARMFGDGPTVMKGFDQQRVANIIGGKWSSFKKPVAVGLDAVKFDMHVAEAMLRWEHSLYLEMYRRYGNAELRQLLEWQVDNWGVGHCADGSLRYKVRGKRFSGDMNTALGNCIIMCGMVHSYLKEKGIAGKLVNNGDDCVVFMEQEDLELFLSGLDEWFLQLGFRMTAEKPVFNLAEIEFCQSHPIRVKDGLVMVRNIGPALVKDTSTVIKFDSHKAMRGWMTAVGQCGMSLAGGVPIAQELYHKFQEMGGGVVTGVTRCLAWKNGLSYMSEGMSRRYEEPLPQTREDVWIAWGITPDEQVAVEKYLREYEFHFAVEERELDEIPPVPLMEAVFA